MMNSLIGSLQETTEYWGLKKYNIYILINTMCRRKNNKLYILIFSIS